MQSSNKQQYQSLTQPPIARALAQDIASIANPDTSKFTSYEDALSRLMSYHIVADTTAYDNPNILEAEIVSNVDADKIKKTLEPIYERMMVLRSESMRPRAPPYQ
ncbi:hypothetical protein SeMB42_g02308 [Synchytrium endobioticum]|uniref:GLTSCR protein conserved domain-containing protein n=1 Tax=Synchytrium endobioticum TaxID=286115 RepID=A0A507CUW4_9FUNG|nr:hypothetical protein SeLEV6574_g05316 [Synchytrium endobioticum]TPX50302.1 hypothetical protein SeMB42_g02308 [Synchytrium endobioticum]